MSDIGISYSARCTPDPVHAVLQLGLADGKVRATVDALDSFTVSLTPTGSIGEEILSGIAWPVAQTLGVLLPPLAQKQLIGRTFDLLSVPTVPPQQIAGETFTPVLDAPSLAVRDGMVALRATPKLT